MLEHLVCNLRDTGITEIILVVGYKEESIRQWFGDGSALGVSITYVVQRRQLGTADALRVAEPFVHGRFMMLNGDMIVEVSDLKKLAAMQAPVMAVSTTEHPENFGVVTVSGEIITSLEEKTPHPKSNIINAGAYLFDPEIFTILKQVSPSSRGEYELTDALMDYIAEAKTAVLYPFCLDGCGISMGSAFRKRETD
jgi:dTDP-glucose pyrophosphorylase